MSIRFGPFELDPVAQDLRRDSEHGLNNAINKLRQALNDSSAPPRYVETVPRRGYRFVAQAEADRVEANGAEVKRAPRRLVVAIGAALLVLAIAGGAVAVKRARAPARFRLRRDWRGAEADLPQAIELDPDFVKPHETYSQLLAAQGRWGEAQRESGHLTRGGWFALGDPRFRALLARAHL